MKINLYIIIIFLIIILASCNSKKSSPIEESLDLGQNYTKLENNNQIEKTPKEDNMNNYETIKKLADGYIIVKYENKFNIFSPDNTEIFQWKEVEIVNYYENQDIAIAKEGNFYGVLKMDKIDSYQTDYINWIIEPYLEEVSVEENKIVGLKNNIWGNFDFEGNVIFTDNPDYITQEDLEDGYILYSIGTGFSTNFDGSYNITYKGIAKIDGAIITDNHIIYVDKPISSDENAPYLVRASFNNKSTDLYENGYSYYVDKNYQKISKKTYTNAQNFIENFAWVSTTENPSQYTLIDYNEYIIKIFPGTIDKVESFNKGISVVYYNYKEFFDPNIEFSEYAKDPDIHYTALAGASFNYSYINSNGDEIYNSEFPIIFPSKESYNLTYPLGYQKYVEKGYYPVYNSEKLIIYNPVELGLKFRKDKYESYDVTTDDIVTGIDASNTIPSKFIDSEGNYYSMEEIDKLIK